MNMFPFSNIKWWFGVVESIMDPEEKNRVQVRMFSIHSEKKNKTPTEGIPTEELPWAQVAASTDSNRMHGLGTSPHSLTQGTQVAGIFADGMNAQIPIVMFAIGTQTPEEKPDSGKGFSDPDGQYPLEDKLGVSHVNRLATSEFEDHPINQTLTDNKVDGEPEQDAAPVYPYNKVLETTSGHIVEYDDTEGAERVRMIHRTGSYVEMKEDGRIVIKSISDQYLVSGTNVNIIVPDGDANITAKQVFMEGTDLVEVRSNLIKLGVDASEAAVLGESLLDYIANHIHNTSQGPSSPPQQAPRPELLSKKSQVE